MAQFQDDYNPENYLSNIRVAIEKVQTAMPRTMVHVVAMFDITPLQNFSTSRVCDIAHMY